MFTPCHINRIRLRFASASFGMAVALMAICAYGNAYSNDEITLGLTDSPPPIFLWPPELQQHDIVSNLYVWRHGETSSNNAKILSGGGDVDAELTENGYKQAFELRDKILHLKLPLQAICSSDLCRAMETAQPVLTAFAGIIKEIIPLPQLREILHGKYERMPAEERSRQAKLTFRDELDRLEMRKGSIRKDIEKGLLDRYFFCRIHPLSGRAASAEGTKIDVRAYIQNNEGEPETPYELYFRLHAELVRIAEEAQDNGLIEIGISTHGAVLATLINMARYRYENSFVPPHYQSEPVFIRGELTIPGGVKIENCALAHFRYYHASKHLEFCGMLVSDPIN